MAVEMREMNGDLEDFSKRLGYEQMAHFMIKELAAEPLIPAAWLGMDLRQLVDKPVRDAFHLAHTLGMMFMRMKAQKENGGEFITRVENNEDRTDITDTDIFLFEQLIAGAMGACLDSPDAFLSKKTREFLGKYLSTITSE